MTESNETQIRSSSSLLDQVPPCVSMCSHEYGGVIWSIGSPVRCLRRLRKFQVRHDDVFVVSYPKSGTTWSQMIAVLVKLDGGISRMKGVNIMNIVPYLDVVDADLTKDVRGQLDTAPSSCEKADAMPVDSPRILKSHSLSNFLPEDIADDPKAKVIYVARNPKDTAVSYYHFCQLLADMPHYQTWNEFFEEFIAGRALTGPWFENVLHWWRLRNHPNVLFLQYEDMKKDGRRVVEQIATFMGKSFSDEIIDNITAATTFKSMKENPVCNVDIALESQIVTGGTNKFFRKGTIGDWKNYFTDDQNRRFDELYKEKIAGSGLEMTFE